MLLFIIGCVVALIALIGLIGGLCCGEKAEAISVGVGGAVIAAILIVLSCINPVPAGHTGVVTTFGRVENYTLTSGLNFTAPWQKVIKMDNRVQKQTVDLMCFSSDIQEVTMKDTVNYQN